MRPPFYITLVCLAFHFPAHAQNAPGAVPRLSLINDAFSEVWRSEVPVAGGVRVGILAGTMDKAVIMDALAVQISTPVTGKLCVDIISRDGRYNAHMEYGLPDQTVGNHLLDFPTQRSEILSGYKARELAVLAYQVTDKCKTRKKQYLVAQWGVDSGFEQITILLNTGGLETSIVLPSSTGETGFSKCQPAYGDMKRTAFDTECTVELLPEMLSAKFKIRRKNYENRLPDVKLPLLVK